MSNTDHDCIPGFLDFCRVCGADLEEDEPFDEGDDDVIVVATLEGPALVSIEDGEFYGLLPEASVTSPWVRRNLAGKQAARARGAIA